MIMPASKAQQKAVAKYESANYDKVLLRLEKGKREKIKAHAESMGETTNGFIKRAIDNQISRDNGNTEDTE